MTMPMPGAGATPEFIGRFAIDGSGLKEATGELMKQDGLFKSIKNSLLDIEGAFGHVASTIGTITGVAGLGAMVSQMLRLGDAASQLAGAAGQLTGGVGAWSPYQRAMNQVQAQTGVSGIAVAQGLITAINQVGGQPSAAQARTIFSTFLAVMPIR